MQFTDTAKIGAPRYTANGYMVVDAAIARTGTQRYRGSEVGRPDMEWATVHRPEAEVFHNDAMASFTHRPVTDDHPAEMVSAANWKQHARGMTGDAAVRDGDHVRVPFTLMDGGLIEKVRSGKRELSAGYTADIEWTPGTTAAGEQYDAVMKNLRGNHLAVVQQGRAGASCSIGDSWNTPSTAKETAMADTNRAVIVDGVTYQVTDQGAQIIERLQTQVRDANTARDQASAQVDVLKASHTQAITAKDAEIAAGVSKLPTPAMLDAMVATRTVTIGAAKRVLGDGFDPAGKTDADIRRAAVTKLLGDAKVAGKSDDYIAAAFDVLPVTDARAAVATDPVRAALLAGAGAVPLVDAADPYDAMCHQLRDAWKTPAMKGAA